MEMKYQLPVPCNFSKKTISSFAEDVARKLELNNGSELEEIVARLGGHIRYQDIWDLGTSESGSIEIEASNNFTISIAAHTSKARDRFTIAHELGHYFLHYRLPESKGVQMTPMRAMRYGGDRAEIEANWFAAAFLMPEAAYRARYAALNGDFEAIAQEFGVSQSAATIRSKSLNLG